MGASTACAIGQQVDAVMLHLLCDDNTPQTTFLRVYQLHPERGTT